MDRTDILNGARSAVCGDRDHDYGGPEKSFETIAALWNAYLNARDCMHSSKMTESSIEIQVCEASITPADVAAMMALLKIARIAKTPEKMDSWVDLAGYAACGGECADKEEVRCDPWACVKIYRPDGSIKPEMVELMAKWQTACDHFSCDDCPYDEDGICHRRRESWRAGEVRHATDYLEEAYKNGQYKHADET